MAKPITRLCNQCNNFYEVVPLQGSFIFSCCKECADEYQKRFIYRQLRNRVVNLVSTLIKADRQA